MPRRIDIELTSELPDGSWTWRAAGAKNPKGTVTGDVLPEGSSVGDELKVEVEQDLDGIQILSVVRGREKKERDLLELLPTEEKFEAVIQTRAKRDRGQRRDRGGKGGRDRRDRRGRQGEPDGEDRRERRGPRRPRTEAPPEVPQRPKPKRLRPGKARRNEVLAELPEEQRPVAEVALQGMQAVRQRLAEENKRLQGDGKPTMPEASVLKMAEELLPRLRVADWLDRAEAAKRQIANLDLRDLRSVVAASNDPVVARDESTRDLAEQLKRDLVVKQEEELELWEQDIDAALTVGRSIRALRLSSQPPKAGVMFPPALARRLGEAATASLTADDFSDRWIAVMEAAAFSPVRTLVTPTEPPHQVSEDLKKTALRLGPLLPQVAALLGVEVPADQPQPKPLRPQRPDNKRKRPARRDDDRGPGAGRAPGRAPTPQRGPKADQGSERDRRSSSAGAAEQPPAAPPSPEREPAAQPDAAEPDSPATQPDATQPDTPAAQPDAAEPDTPATQPDATQPDAPAAQPAPTEPDTPATQPDAPAAQPAPAEPDTPAPAAAPIGESEPAPEPAESAAPEPTSEVPPTEDAPPSAAPPAATPDDGATDDEPAAG